MAIANYGLKSGGTPSPQDVTDRLETNGAILMDVAQGMVNGVQGLLNANAQLLARVDHRIRRSVQGLIARNVALLSPIGENMFNGVYNAVAEIQGALDLISGKAAAPAPPAGGEASPTATPFPPTAPPPTALPSGAAVPPSAVSCPTPVTNAPPAPPGCYWAEPPSGSMEALRLVCNCTPGAKVFQPAGTPPVSGAQPPAVPTFPGTFLILINCQIQELAAVPEPDNATLAQLESEGWCAWGPEPRIYCSDPTTCQNILEQLREQALQACADWQSSGQPCPTLG